MLAFAQSVLPRDDSSLQWSSVGVGRTSDPAGTLEKLYERMVTRYDDRGGHHVDDDPDEADAVGVVVPVAARPAPRSRRPARP